MSEKFKRPVIYLRGVFVLICVVCVVSTYFHAQAVTFTAGAAKRDGKNTFAGGVMVQGGLTEGASSDTLTFPIGTQMGTSQQFYSNFDSRQGSISFWITPQWSGNDGITHTIFDASAATTTFIIQKTSANNLALSIGTSTGGNISITTDISAWTMGQTHHVVVRWDQVVIDGSKYMSMSIDNSHTYASTSAPSAIAAGSTLYFGSSTTGTNPANSLIDGFTIFRRVLTDGTNGINVGNSNEISAIYNAGAGKDPTAVMGSWDIVFMLPTNSTIESLATTDTNEAWGQPYSSSLIWTSRSNTGGFMLRANYTTDGWGKDVVATVTNSPATANKIYAGGYAVTSLGQANKGIYYDKSVTAGDDIVVRAIVHSDGTCNPYIVLYNQTDGTTIGQLAGATTSTRTAPNALLLSAEIPGSGAKTLRIKLLNSATTGTCLWHQVEVYSNILTEPSFQTGSGDPWIPTGWSNQSASAGELTQELATFRTGTSALLLNSNSHYHGTFYTFSGQTDKFWAWGGFSKAISGNIRVYLHQSCCSGNNNNGGDPLNYINSTPGSWVHMYGVYYRNTWPGNEGLAVATSEQGNGYVDDVYEYLLTAVTLTATPANVSASTESGAIRVDGRDTYAQSGVDAISTSSGFLTFDWNPRYSAANAVVFAETTASDAYLLSLSGDGDDYIKIYWDSANTLKMDYSMGGTTASGSWDATGVIAANTTYPVQLAYTGGSSMTLTIGGTARITLTSIPSAFGTAPNTVYFGSDPNGANQGDSLFSNIVFDSTPPAISLTALSPDPNGSATPSVTGSVTDAISNVSNVQYQIDSTSGSWSSCTAGDGSFDETSETFTCSISPALTDGAHTIYVRATDSSGNTTANQNAETDTFTIDTTKPVVTVTAVSPDPGNDATPAISGTATDATSALTTIEFLVDSGVVWTNCTATDGAIDELSEAFTCTPSTLTEGSHTIYVRAYDTVNNKTTDFGSDTFVVDTIAPTLSLTAISPDPGTDKTPVLAGSATDATTQLTAIEFQVDSTSGSWTSCSADDETIDEATEDFDCQIASDLSDGIHTIYIRATDSASNTSSITSDSFTIDITAAETGDLIFPDDGDYINNTRPTFKWKSFTDDTAGLQKYVLKIEADGIEDLVIDNISPTGSGTQVYDTYEITYDGTTIKVTLRSSSAWGHLQNDGKLQNGEYTWTVTAYDLAGNTVSAQNDFYADFTNPQITASVLKKDVVGEKDTYNIVTNQQFFIDGQITDNQSLNYLEIKVYAESSFLGILLAKNLVLTEKINFEQTSDLLKTFLARMSKQLPFDKYELVVTGYDRAGNKSNDVVLKVQLLSADAALKLLAQDKDLSDEAKKQAAQRLKERSLISLPELEKQAIIRRYQQANVLDKFIKDTKALFGGLGNSVSNLALGIVTSSKKLASSGYGHNYFEPSLKVISQNIKNQNTAFYRGFNKLAQSLNNTLTASRQQANLSQRAVKGRILKQYSSTQTQVDKFKYAVDQTYTSITQPLEKQKGFVKRTLAWLGTFHAIVVDDNPTMIFNVQVANISATEAIISWDTNHYSSGKINYGMDLTYGHEVHLTDLQKHHEARIINLEPNSRYFFEVMSHGKTYTYDAFYSFVTLQK